MGVRNIQSVNGRVGKNRKKNGKVVVWASQTTSKWAWASHAPTLLFIKIIYKLPFRRPIGPRMIKGFLAYF